MFLREVVTGRREGKPVRYAQIVEAYRNDDGKSRHRVLLALGRVDRLDRDQVRRLVVALSRYLETGALPEGGRVGEVRDFGIGYLADALWRRFGLTAFFAHRMMDPASKLASWEWLLKEAWLPSTSGLQLQHFYRAMDFLDDCHEPLEEALYAHRRTLFDRVELVYYDTTSTYFECDESGDEPVEYGLRQRGYSRDERPDRKQIVIGLAVDQQGLPIASDVHSGDTSDALTVVPMLERLKRMGLRRILWVADRGMASTVNLSAVRAAGLHYIVGVRLRAVEELRSAITRDKTPYLDAAEGLQVKEMRVDAKRTVLCFSPASAERDLKLRTGAIERMRPHLERANRGGDAAPLAEHGLYRRFVTRRSDGTWQLDKAKLEREAQCDGTFVLEVSDEKIPAATAALAYKGLLRVEQSFRTLKNGVDIRPVYHRLDKRIRAHVSLCMLAYLLERIVEVEAKISFTQARSTLKRLRAVELRFDEQRVWETSAGDPELRRILTALQIPTPPRVLGPA